jgi:Putative collagen-binding domain of a collagenase
MGSPYQADLAGKIAGELGLAGCDEQPGSRSMTPLTDQFARFSSWKLVPNIQTDFLRRGEGDGLDGVAPAMSVDKSFTLLYVPDGRSVDLDLAEMDGARVTLTWCDPSSGSLTLAAASPLAVGTRRFEPLRQNSGGATDSVLVAESA